MKLYLVQHGEAHSKTEDAERPLTKKGQRDVKALAKFLSLAAIKPDKIIHSGKLRAKQSAEILSNKIAPELTPESVGIINPDDDPKAFIWQDESWDHDTLVVGHMPFMSKLVSILVTETEAYKVVNFLPGSIVCVIRDEHQKWQIEWMLRPELLQH